MKLGKERNQECPRTPPRPPLLELQLGKIWPQIVVLQQLNLWWQPTFIWQFILYKITPLAGELAFPGCPTPRRILWTLPIFLWISNFLSELIKEPRKYSCFSWRIIFSQQPMLCFWIIELVQSFWLQEQYNKLGLEKKTKQKKVLRMERNEAAKFLCRTWACVLSWTYLTISCHFREKERRRRSWGEQESWVLLMLERKCSKKLRILLFSTGDKLENASRSWKRTWEGLWNHLQLQNWRYRLNKLRGIHRHHSFFILQHCCGDSTGAFLFVFCSWWPTACYVLQVTKKNVLKDFVSIAGPLNVSHFMVLSRKDYNVQLRVIRLPRGPTLTFRLLWRSLFQRRLAKDAGIILAEVWLLLKVFCSSMFADWNNIRSAETSYLPSNTITWNPNSSSIIHFWWWTTSAEKACIWNWCPPCFKTCCPQSMSARLVPSRPRKPRGFSDRAWHIWDHPCTISFEKVQCSSSFVRFVLFIDRWSWDRSKDVFFWTIILRNKRWSSDISEYSGVWKELVTFWPFLLAGGEVYCCGAF